MQTQKNLIAYPSPLRITVEKLILWQRNNRITKCKWSNLIAADNQLRCSTWMKSHIEYFLDSLLTRTRDKAVRPLCLSTSIAFHTPMSLHSFLFVNQNWVIFWCFMSHSGIKKPYSSLLGKFCSNPPYLTLDVHYTSRHLVVSKQKLQRAGPKRTDIPYTCVLFLPCIYPTLKCHKSFSFRPFREYTHHTRSDNYPHHQDEESPYSWLVCSSIEFLCRLWCFRLLRIVKSLYELTIVLTVFISSFPSSFFYYSNCGACPWAK
jgi:hypothetical protein